MNITSMMRFLVLPALAFTALACNGDEGSPTPAPTATASPPATATATAATPTPTVTATASATATATTTATPTPTPTVEPSPTTTPTGEPEPVFDPARADELAHAAMIEAGALPGERWEITGNDEFEEGGVVGDIEGSAPSCAGITEESERLIGVAETARAGRSNRQFSRPGPDPNLDVETEVLVTLDVMKDADTVASLVSDYRDLFGDDGLGTCLSDTLRESIGEDEGTATLEVVTPQAEAPDGAVTLAFVINVTSAEINGVLRYELYAWQAGNAMATAVVRGQADDIDRDLAQAAVDAMTDSVGRVAAGNLLTPTPRPADLLYDPSRADDYAHGALLDAEDIEGDGWEMKSVDLFIVPVFFAFDAAVPECVAVDDTLAEIADQAGLTIADSARIALWHQGALPFTTEITMEVQVYWEGGAPAPLLEAYRPLLADGLLAACSAGQIARDTKAKATGEAVDPATTVEFGLAGAFEVTTEAGDVFRLETYIWTRSNALAILVVSGDASQVSPDLVKSTLSKAIARLAEPAIGE